MKNKTYIILTILIYRIILDISYLYLVSPQYSYSGMIVDDFNLFRYLLSWIIVLLSIPIINKCVINPNFSSHSTLLLILWSLFPSSTLLAFISVSYEFYLLIFIFWISFFFFYKNISLIRVKKIKGINFKILFYFIYFTYVITIFVISFIYRKFQFNLDLYAVYDLRESARNLGIPLIFNYILASSNTIMPIFFIYFMLKKKRIITGITFIIILLNFGIAGDKTIVFMLLLTIIAYYFYKTNYIKYFSAFLIAVLIFSFGEYYLLNTSNITTFISNRTLFLPARLHYYYYDFFSTHPFDYFKQGILRRIGLSSQYNENIAFILGEEYFNSDFIRANNGLFSEAYSNLGYLGVILIPFLIMIILKLFDGITININFKFLIVPVLSVVLPLISAPISTALLTNGIIFVWFILYIMRDEFIMLSKRISK